MTTDSSDSTQTDKLKALLGTWTGVTRTWFEPGSEPITEANTGSFRPGVNDNFVIYEYESQLDGKPFQGLGIYGYDEEHNRFQCAWTDSFHMGGSIMFSEGAPTEQGFWVLGSYTYGDTTWGWRTVVEISDTGELRIAAFNVLPEGEEHLGVETVYTRS